MDGGIATLIYVQQFQLVSVSVLCAFLQTEIDYIP